MKSDLVVVATFRSTPDAQIAKGILDEAGIESMIRADNAGGMYPAISGAELLVRTEDVQTANEALNRRHHPSTDAPETLT
jgi:Putative prokaryotic signal transducing protein